MGWRFKKSRKKDHVSFDDWLKTDEGRVFLDKQEKDEDLNQEGRLYWEIRLCLIWRTRKTTFLQKN